MICDLLLDRPPLFLPPAAWERKLFSLRLPPFGRCYRHAMLPSPALFPAPPFSLLPLPYPLLRTSHMIHPCRLCVCFIFLRLCPSACCAAPARPNALQRCSPAAHAPVPAPFMAIFHSQQDPLLLNPPTAGLLPVAAPALCVVRAGASPAAPFPSPACALEHPPTVSFAGKRNKLCNKRTRLGLPETHWAVEGEQGSSRRLIAGSRAAAVTPPLAAAWAAPLPPPHP